MLSKVTCPGVGRAEGSQSNAESRWTGQLRREPKEVPKVCVEDSILRFLSVCDLCSLTVPRAIWRIKVALGQELKLQAYTVKEKKIPRKILLLKLIEEEIENVNRLLIIK